MILLTPIVEIKVNHVCNENNALFINSYLKMFLLRCFFLTTACWFLCCSKRNLIYCSRSALTKARTSLINPWLRLTKFKFSESWINQHVVIKQRCIYECIKYNFHRISKPQVLFRSHFVWLNWRSFSVTKDGEVPWFMKR